MSADNQAETPPNIVLVHCHDLGRWLPVYGRLSVEAPHLSALADQSVVFDQAFSTSPLCTPARSSVFTGLSPHVNGLMGLAHQGWTYRPGVRTLPEHLRDLGYRSSLIGLQHEDLDARKLGFDEVHGLGFLPRALEVAGMFERWLPTQKLEEPFFATVGMWEAHRPWPREDYDPVDLSVPEVPAFLPDNEHTRADLAGFYASVAQLDSAIGRVITAIDGSEFGDNTLVLFTTDHGAAFPRAKGTLYDSGLEVSLIVRPPKSWGRRSRRTARLTSHLDILPTLYDVAGGDAGENEWEGESFAELLRPTGDSEADAGKGRTLFMEKTFHDGYDPLRAARTSTYKYIRSFGDEDTVPLALDLELSETRRGMEDDYREPRKSEELYFLPDDPDELIDISETPEAKPVIDEMRQALQKWMTQTKDPILSGAIHPPEPPVRD